MVDGSGFRYIISILALPQGLQDSPLLVVAFLAEQELGPLSELIPLAAVALMQLARDIDCLRPVLHGDSPMGWLLHSGKRLGQHFILRGMKSSIEGSGMSRACVVPFAGTKG